MASDDAPATQQRLEAPGRGAHILLVEDDESIALGLQMNLEAEGYRVSIASDGDQGVLGGLAVGIDLIVVDVMLPRRNGFEVLRELRGKGQRAPIIMLSARGAEEDKLTGLELGAEDYITKPFSLAELLARIKAALRRDTIARPRRERAVTLGDVTVDVETRQVTKAGRSVELTATEFDVLWCLIEAGGGVLTREQILSRLWGPGHHGTPRTVDNFLLHLRSKLEDDPAEPRYLVTVRGAGYRIDA